jgi:alginate O-acetyltransferase complex protein AlgJ
MKLKMLNTIFQRINIVIFFIVIFSPCLVMICGQKTVFSYTEKRALATFPSIPMNVSEVRHFFSNVDSYLDDHFGFREWMVYRYQREIRKRFPDVGILTKVMKGTDDWYFFTGVKMFENFTGGNLRSDKELGEWILSYREKRRWLESNGVRYLFVVPPNKTSVYNEFVGEPWVHKQGMTRWVQIKNQLSDSDRIGVLDLIPVLRKENNTDTLFYRSDTHWTPNGAYLGYLAIAEKIESLLPNIRFKKDFKVSPIIRRKCDKKEDLCDGDLTNMLLDYDSFYESYKDVQASSPCTERLPLQLPLSNLKTDHKDRFFKTRCERGKLKAVVFRDSFSSNLVPLLSENFKEIIYLWKYYDQKNIEEILSQFKPDIVIELKGERVL